ncbi:hypothetical protein [Phormidium sp. CCY1219]|uniref:WD40 domain-containing protein n=1 Tax=Phormidium sp. CCY1219 TaxID=2886104 RepID=UPI002D1E8368|nr:hypothetical protein [Phormidium sp. CCY1219]MEB3826705.1 hypothetical protein [Phormidium sp. CCY1219]
MFTHRHWWLIAEYVCLFASVVAAIAALFFAPLVTVALPFICGAILLNAIERIRLEQLTRRIGGTNSRLNRELSEDVEQLRQQVEGKSLPTQGADSSGDRPSASPSAEAVADLQRRLAALETHKSETLETQIAELKEHSGMLNESISNIIAYLNRSALLSRIERLEEATLQLSSRIETPITAPEPMPSAPAQPPPEGSAEAEPPTSAPQGNRSGDKVVLPSFRKSREPAPQNWSCIQSLPAHADWVRAIAISPDGKILATGSFDTSVKLWKLPSGELMQVLAEHERGVFSLAISSDGETLASASWDKTVKLWRLPGGELVETLSGHTGSVRTVAMHPDGKVLFSGSFDETIAVWDLSRTEQIGRLTDYTGPVYSVAITPDGEKLARGGGDGRITLWQLESEEIINSFTGSLDVVEAMVMTPDGRLMSGNGDGSIQLWELSQGGVLWTTPGHLGPVTALAIAPDGETFASASADGTVKIWHLSTGKLLCTLTEQTGAVMSLAFSPIENLLISGTANGMVKIWQRD